MVTTTICVFISFRQPLRSVLLEISGCFRGSCQHERNSNTYSQGHTRVRLGTDVDRGNPSQEKMTANATESTAILFRLLSLEQASKCSFASKGNYSR